MSPATVLQAGDLRHGGRGRHALQGRQKARRPRRHLLSGGWRACPAGQKGHRPYKKKRLPLLRRHYRVDSRTTSTPHKIGLPTAGINSIFSVSGTSIP